MIPRDDGFKIEQGRGGEGKNTPARSHCLYGKPVHWFDGGSDWCGWLLIDCYLPIKATFYFRSFSGEFAMIYCKREIKYGGFVKFRFCSRKSSFVSLWTGSIA